jgi:hypothetical protein
MLQSLIRFGIRWVGVCVGSKSHYEVYSISASQVSEQNFGNEIRSFVYARETQIRTMREGHKLQGTGSKVLWKIFGPKKDEIHEQSRILRDEEVRHFGYVIHLVLSGQRNLGANSGLDL